MKKIALLLLATILAFPVFAQSEKGYVYLKNGSIVKGKYSYTEDQKKLKVESSGNTWIFETSEIDSISKKREKQSFDIDEIPTKKVFYRTELGVLAGNGENSQSAPFSISASGNYKINSNFSAGIGLGLEFFNETYMPVFANFEYHFKESYSTPFAFLKVGYQVPIENSNAIYYDVQPIWSSFAPWPGEYSEDGLNTKGGVLINPGLGYQQMFNRGFGMSFAIGYQFHRLNYNGENDYSLDIDYNRLSIKIGITFN